MKKLILAFVILPLFAYSQKGITFQIEKLKKPEKLLEAKPLRTIYEQLLLSDMNFNPYEVKREQIDFPYEIIATNKENDALVNYGYHSFFYGMYEAYANHRPFVISPDMMWLLICQGFAQHVNNNSEELRPYFVQFEGKTVLTVLNGKILLDDPNSPWEEVFPEFSKKIASHTGNELIDILTCNFSTSTPVTKIASEITIMETFKPYFQYVQMAIICGIPEITLTGETEDWQKLQTKTLSLRKYKLDWWVDELEPLLSEFVEASKGNIKKDFWRNMFKYHSSKQYGSPKVIDGWIVKFFPYEKSGKRTNLKELNGGNQLPDEIVKVDLLYIKDDLSKQDTTELELWAGFVGLKQNIKTFALQPEIGWMIRKKNKGSQIFMERFNSNSKSEISIRVKTIPNELLSLEKINTLKIDFIDGVEIPEEMSKIQIERFNISGKITEDEIQRICRLFPNTILKINEKIYNYHPEKDISNDGEV